MRLFVAVWPPEQVIDVLYNLPHPEREGVRWTKRDNLHLTLAFMGEVADVDEAIKTFYALPVDEKRVFAATIGPTTALFGSNILQVPVTGLEELAKIILNFPWSEMPAGSGRSFHGHITLARAKERHTISSLAGLPVHASWNVSSIDLMSSQLGIHGSTYEKIASRQFE
ncbi:MAG: RNA 2',3'-cyclic phosphodiesterase [Actinobacteria bacterium]|nr:RNA 2',3'-cyclic phosphodiesterase [Actinomycetota bacterium]